MIRFSMVSKSSRIRTALWLTIILECAIVSYALKPWLDGDTNAYLELARGLASGHYGTTVSGSYLPEAVRPPGYPVLLFVLIHLLHLSHGSVIAVQMALLLFCIFLFERLLLAWNYDALPFLLLASLYPFLQAYTAKLMTEGVTLFLISALIYLIARPIPITISAAALAGILTSAAIMVRANLLLLPMVLVGLFFLRSYSLRESTKMNAKNVGVFLLSVIIGLTPYLVFTSYSFGKASAVPPGGPLGNLLFIATWESKMELADFDALYTGKITDRARSSGFIAEVMEINSEVGAPILTPPYASEAYVTPELQRRASTVMIEHAIRRIRANPEDYARHVISGLWRLWNTGEFPFAMPQFVKGGIIAWSSTIWLLGIFGGVAVALKRQSFLAQAAVMTLLYFPAVHVWLSTAARYTAPARLLLLLTASLAILEILKLIKPRESCPLTAKS